MKFLSVLLFLFLLTSCGAETKEMTKEANTEVVVETTEDTDIDSTVNMEGEKAEEAPVEVITEENSDDMDEEDLVAAEALEEAEESIESSTEEEVMTLEVPYTNPKTTVNMVVNYSVDSEGILTDISVVADNYDLSEFNDAAQSLIGGTFEEATEFYKSGSSLTSTAYQEAMKAELK